MERLKSITIIFLLAVGLLNSVAPAKTTSVLLQEGLYAEEIEGDLDAAIKIYEQVISESKKTQRAAAQATYRIAMCYLKKGEKAKAAEQFRNLISKYPEQQTLGTRAREQLEKLGPVLTGGFDSAEPVPVEQLIKSGKIPAFKTQIYDNTGLDLETGVSVPFMDEWPALCDVAWDNDGGGALMIKPRSSVRFLALGAAEKWEDAISMARNSLGVLRTSTSKGMFASQSKFVAVLTSEGNLAVIQIGEYDAKQGTIYGWIEKMPAEVYCFGPVKEVTLYDVDHTITKGKPCAINFATGRVTIKSRQQQTSEFDILEWVRRRGIDAVLETGGNISNKPSLIGIDLAVVSMPSEVWDTITPAELRTLQGSPVMRIQEATLMSYNEGQDQPVYAFRTRKGQYGILQIIDFNKQAQDVRFRYKMLQQQLPDIETLIKEMHQPEAQRFAALNKLIKIGAPALEPLISELQKSNDWQVPKALGAIGDKRAIEPIIQKWQKCDLSPMKEVIAEALERITGKKLGQDKQKWDKWWQETKRFISPEATIENFMTAAMKLDMNNAMVYVAGNSHDYKDIQAIFEKHGHTFNVLFRKIDPSVPVKIFETKIIDNMCEAVWQVTFKDDFTIEGNTFKAGETFDIDCNLHRYEDKWLITGISDSMPPPAPPADIIYTEPPPPPPPPPPLDGSERFKESTKTSDIR